MRQARGRRQGDGGLSAQARRRVPRAQSARASRVVVLRETSRRRCALHSAARVKYGGLGGGERQTQCLILEGVGLLNSVGKRAEKGYSAHVPCRHPESRN